MYGHGTRPDPGCAWRFNGKNAPFLRRPRSCARDSGWVDHVWARGQDLTPNFQYVPVEELQTVAVKFDGAPGVSFEQIGKIGLELRRG